MPTVAVEKEFTAIMLSLSVSLSPHLRLSPLRIIIAEIICFVVGTQWFTFTYLTLTTIL